ncbi:uncharacterized protein LOC108675551 [Hyalella azteca]|uniref:Uncharacterized protein LOC108675551 n=1 Tax=Hyalella azteca TaxID=294128 RepID=A0A8B7NZD4_HYAAZ|nr:uncharacterized protein LOC108675551 [Hyalella azteca]
MATKIMNKFRTFVVLILVLQSLSVFFLIRTMPEGFQTSGGASYRDFERLNFQNYSSYSEYDEELRSVGQRSSRKRDKGYELISADEEIFFPVLRGYFAGEVLSHSLHMIQTQSLPKIDLLEELFLSESDVLHSRNSFSLVNVISPVTKQNYTYVSFISPEQRKISEYIYEDKISTDLRNKKSNASSNADKSSEELAHDLLMKLTKPTLHCKRMVKMGGRYASKMPDGEKYMCMDPGRMLNAKSCLVYSFGVGYDFTFERLMGIYGCYVVAFDDDESHSQYPSQPYNRVNFISVRLSSSGKIEWKTEVKGKKDGSTSNYTYVYRPLDNILAITGHYDEVLDYLKLDVEGSEWSTFENSIFKSDVLNRTRYLAVELHLIALNDAASDDPSSQRAYILRYLRFFTELENFGFKLLHYDPNFVKPTFVHVFGHHIPVYAELVWWNPRVAQNTLASKHYLESNTIEELEFMN